MEVNGTDGARQAVKENIFNDVDLINVAIEADMSVAEMSAIVDEAHRQHLKVVVHAASAVSIQTAIDAGADSIEHGNGVTDEQLKTMRDKGIFLDLTPPFTTAFGRRFTRRSRCLRLCDRQMLLATNVAARMPRLTFSEY